MSIAQFLNGPVLVSAAVSGLLALAGCASTTPVVDSQFGEAVRAARAAQTLNPQASANRDPVVGIDGRAGAMALERYQDSFKAPPKTFEILNIGGGLSGQ